MKVGRSARPGQRWWWVTAVTCVLIAVLFGAFVHNAGGIVLSLLWIGLAVTSVALARGYRISRR